MKIILSFLISFVWAAQPVVSKLSVDKEKFLKDANGVGFEKLDDTCGDCVDPNWLLIQLTNFVNKYKDTNSKEVNDTINIYLKMIERLRVQYKSDIEHDKDTNLTINEMNKILDAYKIKVSALKVKLPGKTKK